MRQARASKRHITACLKRGMPLLSGCRKQACCAIFRHAVLASYRHAVLASGMLPPRQERRGRSMQAVARPLSILQARPLEIHKR